MPAPPLEDTLSSRARPSQRMWLQWSLDVDQDARSADDDGMQSPQREQARKQTGRIPDDLTAPAVLSRLRGAPQNRHAR